MDSTPRTKITVSLKHINAQRLKIYSTVVDKPYSNVIEEWIEKYAKVDGLDQILGQQES